MSEFSTTISEVSDGIVNLRGYSLEEVMRELSYSEGAFLCLFGRVCSPDEARVVNVLLNSLLDHGWVASTISAARYIASGNPQFIPAVAGGLLAAGSNTVSPQHSVALIERAAELRATRGLSFEAAAIELVDEYIHAGRRIPGLGHPTHKSSDFRADVLFDVARETGLAGGGIRQYQEIHRQFRLRSGRANVPINVDGAIAAVAVDLGWSAHQTVSLAVLSVLPGIMAHVIEELESGRPLRHITSGTYAVAAVSRLPVQASSTGKSEVVA